MTLKIERIEIRRKKKLKYLTLRLNIFYIELILNKFSTTEIESFLAKNTTRSSF